jgi:hypothetical protein
MALGKGTEAAQQVDEVVHGQPARVTIRRHAGISTAKDDDLDAQLPGPAEGRPGVADQAFPIHAGANAFEVAGKETIRRLYRPDRGARSLEMGRETGFVRFGNQETLDIYFKEIE